MVSFLVRRVVKMLICELYFREFKLQSSEPSAINSAMIAWGKEAAEVSFPMPARPSSCCFLLRAEQASTDPPESIPDKSLGGEGSLCKIFYFIFSLRHLTQLLLKGSLNISSQTENGSCFPCECWVFIRV